ncbi:MAG: hypothetical protein JSS27_15290 [Planctomycetes bacterium]|nr:hypothetical protein [Planctomycetota bacterium]
MASVTHENPTIRQALQPAPRATAWLGTATAGEPTRRQVTLAAFAVALLVFASRCWCLDIYSVSVPFWDQWDAEAMQLYVPALEGRLTASALFAPHNEHRITSTRLLDLALLKLNGRWEPRLQTTVGAFLSALTALFITWCCGRLVDRRVFMALAIGIAMLFGVPYGHENLLCGFQCQFYFLVLFSLVAIAGLTQRPPLSAGWIVGALAAVAAILSLGSGLMAAAAVVVVEGYSVWSDRTARRTHLPTLALATGIVIAGALGHTSLPAPVDGPSLGVSDFIYMFGRALAWPCKRPWLAPLMYAPLATLLMSLVRRPRRLSPLETFALGLGVWTVAQAAGIAWARGSGGLASRYLDLLVVGPIANLLALAALTPRFRLWARVDRRSPLQVLTLVWTLAAIAGTLHATRHVPEHLDRMSARLEAGRQACVAFFAGDQSHFPADATLPYPDAARLATLLRHPTLRPILPTALDSSTLTQSPGPLATAAEWTLGHAWLFALAGAVMLASSFYSPRRAPATP